MLGVGVSGFFDCDQIFDGDSNTQLPSTLIKDTHTLY